MSNLIQLRRDTEANWTANNPILAAGELALTTDTDPPKLKVGDGTNNWSTLTYITGTGGGGGVTSVGLSSSDLSVSGSPVTSSGTITANLVTQGGVTPGAYGDANTVAQVTVNSKGIVTAVSNVDIDLPISQIDATGTPSATTFLRGDGSWATPSGGGDPWTIVRITSDFVTSSATAVNVTGLNFTPSANNRYEFYGMFLLRTATTTVGPRPGVSWPTGLSDGAVMFLTPSSATANLTTNGNISASVLVAVGGLPSTTGSWLGTVNGYIIAGASPSGNVQIQLASETAGTNVTMRSGSYIAYRIIT